MESLTGSNSRLGDVGGTARLNTLDRNLERLDGVDADAARKAGANSVPITTGAPTP